MPCQCLQSYSCYQLEITQLFDVLLFKYEDIRNDLCTVLLNLESGNMPLAPLSPIVFSNPEEDLDDDYNNIPCSPPAYTCPPPAYTENFFDPMETINPFL
jgi:hypothetical protein